MLLNSGNAKLGWKLIPFYLLANTGKRISTEMIFKNNGLAIAFICNHCPYVKDIINRMVEDFNELLKIKVGVVAIMPNDTNTYPEDSYENMIKFAKKNKFTFPYLYDEDQKVAAEYNAVCTPDFFCFDKNKQLFYRGRLDNLKYQSKHKYKRKKELIEAYRLKINDNNIQSKQHASMGCSIKWKKNII